ncbi:MULTISPECIES: mechanosensitive ion channel family protein [Synechocystis]|nr:MULTISPECIES: mechanosensitive ion channel family protein [Synechocystis]
MKLHSLPTVIISLWNLFVVRLHLSNNKGYIRWHQGLNLLKLITITLLVFFCTIGTAQGQNFFSQLPDAINQVEPIDLNSPVQNRPFSLGFDPNLSGSIGNLDYTTVRVDGEPIFLIAVPTGNTDKEGGSALSPIVYRQQRIESKFKEIIQRGFDPDTLSVASSILNGAIIIQISDDKNLRPQILRTITKADADLYALTPEDLASETVDQVRNALLRAQQERQPEARRKQTRVALVIVSVVITVSLTVLFIYRWLGHRIYLIKMAINCLIKAEEKNPDFDYNHIDPAIFNDIVTIPRYSFAFQVLDRIAIFLYYLSAYCKAILFGDINRGDSKKNPPLNFSLDNQKIFENILELFQGKDFYDFLKNRLKQVVFSRRLLIFFIFIIWIRGSAFLLQVFPDSRRLGKQLSGTPISLTLIWLSAIILIRISDFLIESFFHTLESDYAILQTAKYTRRKIRINTISSAVRGINLVVCIFTALVFSLSLFDVPVATVLAGAGIIGFAVSFGSQNLIKDLIAGISNLMSDAFAINDFVLIGEFEGVVEDTNLFVTRIRCPNGDLVTIPNGAIGTVCNQTKDWSRVDYSVMVAADADPKKAIAVLQQVALGLYHDPWWHPKMLQAPELKGIEEVSHQGIRIRIWLKTLPGEQWDVARELRLRVRVAFESQEIAIGVPQQQWLMAGASSFDEKESAITDGEK